MKRTVKEILGGLVESVFQMPSSEVGCGLYLAFIGLFFLMIPMSDGEKPIWLTLFSVAIIIVAVMMTINRIKSTRDEEDKGK